MSDISNAASDFSDSLINKNDSSVSYQFSGYQLPRVQLDETGPGYVVGGVHPYFTTQPTFWEKPYYQLSVRVMKGEPSSGFVENVPENFEEQLQEKQNSQVMSTRELKEDKEDNPPSSPKLFGMKPI